MVLVSVRLGVGLGCLQWLAAVGGEEIACRRAFGGWWALGYNNSGLALTWSSVVACATVTLYLL